MLLLLYFLYINFLFNFSSANTCLNNHLLLFSLNRLQGSFKKFQPFIILVQLLYSFSNFKFSSYIIPFQTILYLLIFNKSNSYSSYNQTVLYSPLIINCKFTSIKVCFLIKILLLFYITLSLPFILYQILNLYIFIYKT